MPPLARHQRTPFPASKRQLSVSIRCTRDTHFSAKIIEFPEKRCRLCLQRITQLNKDKFFGSHESLTRDEDQQKASSNRSFGFVFAGFFGLLGTLSLYEHGPRWPLWLSLAALFALLGWLCPVVLGPLNRAWMKLGLLLYTVISPVALAILFYLCLAPIGFLMRLSGKDPLRRRMEPNAKSYWILREPPGPSSDSLKNQF